MASWLRTCSSARHAAPTNPPAPERARRTAVAAACGAALLAGCGHADTTAPAESAVVRPDVFCTPAAEGFLRARLQGAIDAELDWSAPGLAQCLGAPRPHGDGVRLLYKGQLPEGPLLVVIGIARLGPGASARNLPANVTLVREGSGAFYSTQGDDKCAVDDVRQEPLAGHDRRYRLTARGYCTQPARALGAEGAVLVTRFDLSALVEYPQEPG
jgi:hypothetical protein